MAHMRVEQAAARRSHQVAAKSLANAARELLALHLKSEAENEAIITINIMLIGTRRAR